MSHERLKYGVRIGAVALLGTGIFTGAKTYEADRKLQEENPIAWTINNTQADIADASNALRYIPPTPPSCTLVSPILVCSPGTPEKNPNTEKAISEILEAQERLTPLNILGEENVIEQLTQIRTSVETSSSFDAQRESLQQVSDSLEETEISLLTEEQKNLKRAYKLYGIAFTGTLVAGFVSGALAALSVGGAKLVDRTIRNSD